MAKVIMSAAVSQASGKIGGIAFSKGPFGLVIITKTSPINSESNAQLGIKGSFQTLTKRWAGTLTAAQQAAWIALAAANKVHDVFGNLITLTGIQFYVKLNGSLHSIGVAPIDTAPSALATGTPGVITVNAVGGGSPSLTVSTTTAPAGNELAVVWSMHPVRIGQKAVLKKLAIVQYFPAGTGGPYDIFAAWNPKYGQLLPGMVIAAKVQFTANDTGFQGLAYQGAGIAT